MFVVVLVLQFGKLSFLLQSSLPVNPEWLSKEAFGSLINQQAWWVDDIPHPGNPMSGPAGELGDLQVGGIRCVLTALRD